ncbi:MAG: caspase family protein [Bacteroidota bacterium]|nr:caspase family protein [Bacteroidota bacterium]
MKRLKLILVFFACIYSSFSQLKDIKLIIPKELGYSYYDFVQFLPGENYFVICSNYALSVYNTETAEVVDEYAINYGAKNLSISNDGNSILITINNELFVFSFKNQKLELEFKTNTATLIEGQPNSQYYGGLPIGGCFFTPKKNEIYVSLGSFTLIYDIEKKSAVNSFAFPLTDYVMNSGLYAKKQEVIMAKTTGTINAIYRQSLTDLNSTSEIIKTTSALAKIRVRDSLLFGFTSTNYFILNLETGQIVHEVEMMKYNYDYLDKTMQAQANKRPAMSVPDKINFSSDEFIYDIDFQSGTNLAVYATNKGLKYIDLKTKKLVKQTKNLLLNLRFSNKGNRLIANTWYPYKALKVFDPKQMKLISEKHSYGNSINSADVSPNKQWMFTNSGNSGFVWDLTNFTKHVNIKDISNSDSSFIYNSVFLNDSELVVNSGKSFNHLNLSIYNIRKKKYTKTLKKNVYSFISGFIKNEFYYSDYNTLTIVNLKTLTEEKYEGMFSFAASNPEQIINFTDKLIFIPLSTGFKIVNRKTKVTEYETKVWASTARVIISPDEKYIFTSSQIKKKQNVNGYEMEMDVFAIVRIDMTKKQIVNDYAVTYFPYDFKINGNTIGMWYLKHDYASDNKEKETVYSEYDIETGKEISTKTITKTKDMLSFHYTSPTGKYIGLHSPNPNYLKIFDDKGNEVIDLSDLKLLTPKCFFIESSDKLIITSPLNSLATFVDLKNKKIIGQLANASNDNYFLVTSDLHYLGSKEFVKSIRFKYQSEIYSFEQFDAFLNQPHKVLRAFGCSDSLLIHSYETAYLKRMRILGLKPEGTINFSNLPTIDDVKIKEEKPGIVNFLISANKGKNKLSKLNIYNNGTLISSNDIKETENARFETSKTFETSSGINRFEFTVKDEKGNESPKISRIYNNTSDVKPNLFLVVIASEKFKNNKFDLSYALKDAGDVATTMANSKAFNKIEIKKLFNQSFAADSVKDLKNFFSKATINDVVMVFFAGHGYLDDDFSYYFPTYYTDFTDPKINSVAYTSFEKLFKNMKPTRKLMFIDACFSGEVDEDANNENVNPNNTKDSTRSIRIAGTTFAQSTALEMSKSIFSDIRENSGATIISSAGGTEAAFEGEKWNNGLFTYCLLNGMKSLKADLNNDKTITLSELQKFVAEEVNRLSEGKQTPTYRVENTVLDYELWQN